jgi:uncharacterized protein (TIGR03437 family)
VRSQIAGSLAWLVSVAHPALFAQPAPPAVVSDAARYQPVIAPSSLAAIFGSALAAGIASATLDANGHLPAVLAGTSVTVDGQAAALIYVSPAQINFVVPDGASIGTSNVMILGAGGSSQTTTAQIQNTAIAVFSLDASGSGPGAILNAVTYQPAPFLVETPANFGSDKRTRLAVYATGVRYAGNPAHDPSITDVSSNLSAQATDANGNTYGLTVEYAGPAPGFFGLDQVNVVLPPELDGGGAVSIAITAEQVTSNLVTFQMGSLPPSSIHVAGITLSSLAVNGGGSVAATVSLNAPARGSDFTVALRSNSSAVQVPATATIPLGKTSVQVTLQTSTVVTAQTATISAQGNGVTQTATLEIDPAGANQLSNLTVAPPTVLGGQALSATVSLTGPAAGTSAIVQLSSNNAAAQPPATVPVLLGQSSTTFSIPTSAVTSAQAVTITATLGGSSTAAQVTVAPPIQLTLASNSVVGGNTVTGMVVLAQAAPNTGTVVTLRSSDLTTAMLPPSINIPSGQTSGSFTISTVAVAVVRTITISASNGTATQSLTLTVSPLAAATLSAIALSPAQVTGGTSVSGTVTLTGAAPAGGKLVNLASSAVFTAQAPPYVVVVQGQTSASFTITTGHVSSMQTVTITATLSGVSKTAILTVQ